MAPISRPAKDLKSGRWLVAFYPNLDREGTFLHGLERGVDLAVVDPVRVDEGILKGSLPQGAVAARPFAFLQHFQWTVDAHQVRWQPCKEHSAFVYPGGMDEYVVSQNVIPPLG